MKVPFSILAVCLGLSASAQTGPVCLDTVYASNNGGGIGGTIMPAASDELTDDDIWALVYYVLSIAEQHDVARAEERRLEQLLAAEEESHADPKAEPVSHD